MESAEKAGGVSDRAREFHEALAKSCIPRIDRATVPIIAVQNDKIIHDRSGVLYRVGNHHFALTAAHDLREIVERNIGLYISVNHPKVMPLPLAEARFISTEIEDRDLAVIWIPPDIASEVSKFKDFMFHNQVSQSADPSRSLLLFYGYPGQWSGHLITETGIVSKALAFSTFMDTLDPAAVQNYDPKLHMLLNYTPTAFQAMTGETETLPPLVGISGCGIWQVADKDGKKAVPRTGDTLRLVGIQHGVFRKLERVKATRIEYALGLIVDHYPDTRAAMSIVYPSR